MLHVGGLGVSVVRRLKVLLYYLGEMSYYSGTVYFPAVFTGNKRGTALGLGVKIMLFVNRCNINPMYYYYS